MNQQQLQTLVGKKIRHKWCNPDSTEQLYTGHNIFSIVPASATQRGLMCSMMVSKVLSLNLSADIDNGDLDVV